MLKLALPPKAVAVHVALAALGVAAVGWAALRVSVLGGAAVGLLVLIAEALLGATRWSVPVAPSVSLTPTSHPDARARTEALPDGPMPAPAPMLAATTPWAQSVPDAFRRVPPSRRLSHGAPAAAVWRDDALGAPWLAPRGALWQTE